MMSTFILWYGKNKQTAKYRQLYQEKVPGEAGAKEFTKDVNEEVEKNEFH